MNIEPGKTYKTRRGTIVFVTQVRKHACGHQVRWVELWPRDLMPGHERPIRMGYVRLCALCEVQR